MEKKLKRKCMINVILLVLGIACIVLSLAIKDFQELQKSYINGLGTSLTVLSIVMLIKNGISLKDPKALRKREIELTDERFKEIEVRSMAITFRICLLIESLTSILLVCMNNEFGLYIGLLVGIQLIIYCISSAIISKKI